MSVQNLDLLALFKKDTSDIPSFSMLHKDYKEDDYMVEDLENIHEREYCCEWGHARPSLVLNVHSVNYNPATCQFEMQGKLLVGCGVCARPIHLNG